MISRIDEAIISLEMANLNDQLSPEQKEILQKGKRAAIGEIREYFDGKYEKTATGWKYIKGSDPRIKNKAKTEEKPVQKESKTDKEEVDENKVIISNTKFGKLRFDRTGKSEQDWTISLNGTPIIRNMKKLSDSEAKEYMESSQDVRDASISSYINSEWVEDKKNFNLLDDSYNYKNYVFIYKGKINEEDYPIPRWVRHPDEYGTEEKAQQWEDWSDKLEGLIDFIKKNK